MKISFYLLIATLGITLTACEHWRVDHTDVITDYSARVPSDVNPN